MSGLSLPTITIVVPTRDRPGTLGATIENCLDAADNATEVLVADNASGAETGKVLKRFDDQIRVERSPIRLAMSRNWEFALGHVASDFVLFLGDDDALLPSAISTFDKLPMIYHAFLPMATVRQFVRRYGTPFFRSITPDIYSGFCVSLLDEEYVTFEAPIEPKWGNVP